MTTQISGDTGVSQVQGGVGGVVNAGPAFRATLTNIINTGTSVIDFAAGVKTFDTNNAFNLSTSRFQPNVPGYYSLSLYFDGTNLDSPGKAFATIRKNGAFAGSGGGADEQATVRVSFTAGASCLIYMNGTTDYAEPVSELFNVLGGAGNVIFSGVLVRAA